MPVNKAKKERLGTDQQFPDLKSQNASGYEACSSVGRSSQDCTQVVHNFRTKAKRRPHSLRRGEGLRDRERIGMSL